MKSFLEIINENESASIDEAQSAKVNVGGKEATMNVDSLVNKDENENGSGGKYKIEWPTGKEVVDLKALPKDKNSRVLQLRFQEQSPFFIQGKAGWAKSSMIKTMAKAFGYGVITVFLDKAEPEDLGGIPSKSMSSTKGGHAVQEILLPPWAEAIRQHKDKEFLLFFDELNQANPGIFHALMPIINMEDRTIGGVDFDNYFVAAAGNLKEENRALEDIPAPLMARLGKKPIIWETNTPQAWATAFVYLKKAVPNGKLAKKLYANNTKSWSELLGEEFIDKIESISMLCDSPRDIERYAFSRAYAYSISENHALIDTEDVQSNIIEAIVNEEIQESPDRKQQTQLNEVIEYIANFIQAGGVQGTTAKKAEEEEAAKKPSRRSANAATFGEGLATQCAEWLIKGYVLNTDDPNDKTKYGVSLENIFELVDNPEDEPLTAESKEQLKNTVLAIIDRKGKKPKFETNDEFIKLGYKDPKDAEE